MEKKEIERANPLVPIKLDKERNMLLSLRGIMLFKKETGKDLFDPRITKAISKNIAMDDMIALVWACLIHEDRDLTIEDVGFLIHVGNVTEVMEALEKVCELAMPEGGGKGDRPLAPNRQSRRHG